VRGGEGKEATKKGGSDRHSKVSMPLLYRAPTCYKVLTTTGFVIAGMVPIELLMQEADARKKWGRAKEEERNRTLDLLQRK